MFNQNSIRNVIAVTLVLILLVFAFFIIRPIFFSMLFGLILAYAFFPFNKRLVQKVKSESFSALITCILVVGLLMAGTWFLIPTLITQVFEAYISIQTLDIVSFLRTTFPFLFTTPQISAHFESAYNVFVSKTASVTLERFTNIIVDLPVLALKFFIVLVTFFYGLRDGDKILSLIRDSLPFQKSLTNRFIEKSKQVTFSVIFGRIIVGIATGVLTGLGFYMVGIENSLLLTFLAILASIIPIIGPWIIWIPVVAGLFYTDRILAATFLLFYGGVIINLFENLLHPIFVSRTSKIPTSITLIGIVGGLLVFGIFGLIIGPLVMAYLTVLLEIYRENK